MKRKIALFIVLTMLLPQIMGFVAFGADDNTIVITTGAQFKDSFKSANWGKTFIIEGIETLADGSTGIVLPSNYSSVSAFYGTLKGVDGKNNIQISKPLIASIGLADTGNVVIDNLVLKGSNPDGTGLATYADNAGALINAAATNYPYSVTITNVTNYVDVSSTKSGMSAGGILGYVRYREITIKNCINYGDVESLNGATAAGGIVGRFYGEKSESANISHCVNYGDVTSTGTTGGILGRSGTSNGSITYCANYGNVVSTSTTAIYGAAGIVFNTTPVSYCFNAGNVTSEAISGGIMGYALYADVNIANCFNIGKIISNDTTGKHFAGGIAGSYSNSIYTITNCYNLGEVVGTGAKKIGDTKTTAQDALCTDNYYISDTDLGEPIGINITYDNLAMGLPSNFSASVWEIVSSDKLGSFVNDDINCPSGYRYPQLIGNWIDHAFKLNYKNFSSYRSNSSGAITDVSAGWSVVDKFERATSVYSDVPTETVLTNITYPGVIGATLILSEQGNTTYGLEFAINKTAEIIIAVNRNNEISDVQAVKNGGFVPLEYSDGANLSQAGLVTAGGEQYYLYKKNVTVGSGTQTVSIDAASDLTKGYIVFVNWIDSYELTFGKSGNEKVLVDGEEIVDNTPIVILNGTYYNVEISPNENYYIKSIKVNEETIEENLIDKYESSYLGNKNYFVVVETSEYLLNDLNYSVVQGIGANNTVKQTFKAEGNIGAFLDGGAVTCKLSKNSSELYTKTETIAADGSIVIEFPLLDSDAGELAIEFTVEKDGVEADVVIDNSKKTYTVESVADINSILGKLNSDSMTADEFTALVLEEKPSLRFNTAVFKGLTPAVQKLISESFIEPDDYTVDNIYERYNNEVIFKTINNSQKSQDFKNVIATYSEDIGLNGSSLYAKYIELLTADPEPVYTILKNNTYSSYADILAAFEYGVIYGELSNITSYDSIKGILNKYKALLGIEAEITAIDNMNSAKIKIVNDETGKALNTLVTKELLKEKLDYLITNIDTLLRDKLNQNAAPSRPSGGGGGGGGGTSISVSNDYVEKETVEEIPLENSTNDFTDLGDVKWAQESIRTLLYRGVVRGKDAGKFCPSDNVTRAEFVTMVVIALNMLEEEPTTNFKDVPATHWSYNFVASAAEKGIVSGYSSSEFGVNGNITRQDVIAILIRITYKLNLHEKMEQRKEKVVTFIDESEIADYAQGGVNMLSGCGIITGYEDGSFGPKKALTRAEAATILARYLEFFEL